MTGRTGSRRLVVNVQRLLFVATLLLVWEGAVRAGRVDGLLFPPPTKIFQALTHLAAIGQLWADVRASLLRVAVGFGLASMLAVLLAFTIVRRRAIAPYMLVVVDLLRPISVLAWIPLAIIWFGIGNASSWFIIFLGAFFPVFTNAYHGFSSVERTHVLVARNYGVTGLQFVAEILLPSALPAILTGMRVGLGVGWMCLIAAEMISAQSGLGYMIQMARVLIETEKVMAGMVVIGIIGYLMNEALLLAERALTPWRREG